MANGYTNTVPEGRIGTGAAQVLGPNRALQYALQLSQRRQEQFDADRAAYERNMSGYNAAFQKNIMETLGNTASAPLLNRNLQAELSEVANIWARQGGELMSQGINPYNPYQSRASREVANQYSTETAQLRAATEVVKGLAKQRENLTAQYAKDPQKYDLDEYREAINWYESLSLEDVLSGNVVPPAISEVVDISQQASKDFGQVYHDFFRYDTDEQGRPIEVRGRQADAQRILSIANNAVENPNTVYGREVNRRLRRQIGPEASVQMFAPYSDIFDRDELISVIDAQLRNSPEDSPLVDQLAEGKNVQYGTEGYQKTVSDIADQILAANQVIAGAKQEIIDAVTNRTNTREEAKLSYQEEIMNMRRQSHAAQQRNSALAAQNLALRNEKIRNGDDPEIDAMLEGIVDLDFSDYDGGELLDEGVRIPSAIPVSTSTFNIGATDAIDVRTGETVKNAPIRGGVSAVAPVAFDKDGNVVSGDNLEDLATNPRVVEFRPMVTVSASMGGGLSESYIYAPSSLPIETLPSTTRGAVKKAVSLGSDLSKQLNDIIKKRPKSTENTQSSDWIQYRTNVDEAFRPQSQQREKLTW